MHSLAVALFLTGKSIVRANWGLNLMTGLMMVLVYLNLVFTPAFLEGVINTTNQKLISSQTGHITIEGGDVKSGITDGSKLMDDVRKIEGVEGVTGTRSLPAEINHGPEKTTVEVTAVDPSTYGDVFVTPNNMIEGEFLTGSDIDEIVLGAQIAGAGNTRLELYSDSLKDVHVGEEVTVTYSGNIKKTYKVKGIFLNEFVESDLKTIVNDREFNAIQPNSKVENISLKLESGTSEQIVIDKIKKLRGGLEFRTWHERAGFVKSFTDSLEIVNRILRTVALFVAAITIFIVTYVDLVNKRRQIGIERAVGINSRTIILSYVFRAVAYTVSGSILGVVVFMTVVVPLEARYPFTFPFGDVYLAVNPGFLALNAFILIGVGLVSAFIPAWRSMRISIIEAIWGS